MEKINKTDDMKFVVREDFKGKRHVVTSGSSVMKMLLSSFQGEVICAGDKDKTLDTTFQDYFTFDKGVVRGNLKISYSVTDYLNYAKERKTEVILDIIARTILSEYFETLELDDVLNNPIVMDEKDKKDYLEVVNYYVSCMIPWIKVNDISEVIISNSHKYPYKFSYRLNKQINKKSEELSMDFEYYKPQAAFKNDDLSSKMLYPDHRYVAKDQSLFYCGRLSSSGTKKNGKAKGEIVHLGLHVMSTPSQIVSSEINGVTDSRLAVYPNIVYEVTDLEEHYYNYEFAQSTLCKLAEYLSSHLIYDNTIRNILIDVIDVSEIDDPEAKALLEELSIDYGVEVKWILFSQKNPCVKKREFVKTSQDIIQDFLVEAHGNQRKRFNEKGN